MALAQFPSNVLVPPSPRHIDAPAAVALALSTLQNAARPAVPGLDDSCRHALETLRRCRLCRHCPQRFIQGCLKELPSLLRPNSDGGARRPDLAGGRMWMPFEQVLVAGSDLHDYDPTISAAVKEAIACLSGLIRGGGFGLLVQGEVGTARGLIIRACRAFEPEEEPATGDALVELVAAALDVWPHSLVAEACLAVIRTLVLVGARSTDVSTSQRSWTLAVAIVKRCHSAQQTDDMVAVVQALCEVCTDPIPAAALHGSAAVQRTALALQLLRHIFTGPPGSPDPPFRVGERPPPPLICGGLSRVVLQHCVSSVPCIQEITLALVEALCTFCAAVDQLRAPLAAVLFVAYPELLKHSLVSTKSKLQILDTYSRVLRDRAVAVTLYRTFGDQLFAAVFDAAKEVSALCSEGALVALGVVQSAFKAYYAVWRREEEEEEERLDKDEYSVLLNAADGPRAATRSPLTPVPAIMLGSASDQWLCLAPRITPYEPIHLASFGSEMLTAAISRLTTHFASAVSGSAGDGSLEMLHIDPCRLPLPPPLDVPIGELVLGALNTLLPHVIELLRPVLLASGCAQTVQCLKSFYILINGAAAAGSEQGLFMIRQELEQSRFDFPNDAARKLYFWLLENATLKRAQPKPPLLPPAPPMRASPSNIVVECGHYGYFGVASVSGTALYNAQLHVNGVLQQLGTYETAAEAADVVTAHYFQMHAQLPPEKTSRGYYGVSASGRNGFRAELIIDGKQQYLGSYVTAEEAATAVATKHLDFYGNPVRHFDHSMCQVNLQDSSKALYLALRTCTPMQVAKAASAGSVVWLHAAYGKQLVRLEAEAKHLPDEVSSLEARIQETESHSAFASAMRVNDGMSGLSQLQVQDLHALLASTSQTVLSLLSILLQTLPSFSPNTLPSGRGARAALATPLLVELREYQLPATIKSPTNASRIRGSPRSQCSSPAPHSIPSPAPSPRTSRARSVRWSAKDSIAKMNGLSARSGGKGNRSPRSTTSSNGKKSPRRRSNSPPKRSTSPKSAQESTSKGGLVRSILKAELGSAGLGRKGLFREVLKQQFRDSVAASPAQSPRSSVAASPQSSTGGSPQSFPTPLSKRAQRAKRMQSESANAESNPSPRAHSPGSSPRMLPASSPQVSDSGDVVAELSLEQISTALRSGTRSPRSKTPVSASTIQAAIVVLKWIEAVRDYRADAPKVPGYWQLLSAVPLSHTLFANFFVEQGATTTAT